MSRIDDLTHQEIRHYAIVGKFFTNFAFCELILTHLLAHLIKARDMEAFELVVRGMDARVKSERMRRAFAKYGLMGEGFKVRLDFFDKHAIPLRNLLAHNAHFAPSHDADHLLIGRPSKPASFLPGESETVSVERIEDVSDWLHGWAMAIATTLPIRDGQIFEIDHPAMPPR